ncbi:quinone-dependent dihydroorotate dehydrogenase [Parasphingorhabdus halotolerans]|uniref:Dihydroorotate dehydrogenase (quinone) n=1 Tax=Parasphingorhabdus halotolerans TaxID=2725558 RepID=A0A6H2DMB0_9SPHN|nr:quinone-dependent dihydroorotate dehydrogenase [Parasphingorhabdus halotolerans]QJB68891.1 quinone-dependent dihydroorotate dehydrogenase [Parasphingorhabdus halotolerans]
MLYDLAKPFIFSLDAERAHGLTIAALKAVPMGPAPKSDPVLATTVAGLTFPNPIGMAPGFDKNGEVPDALIRMGFGYAEVGTLTPLPQAGNPKPRIFRLEKDKAVINRLGFNNQGQEKAAPRLERMRRRMGKGILGINIGANKDSDDRIADYVIGTRAMAPLADYLTVNISSPNTPGLRALQDKGALEELLSAVMAARDGVKVPVFLKVAPDLEPADIDDIVEVAMTQKIDALIVSNTTITRPHLRSSSKNETGGLSGAPLKDLALQRLKDFRKASGDKIPLIGVGGIATAEDAYERICAGASLVQLYTAMIYKGPTMARSMACGLAKLVKRDGFHAVADAVGTDDK